MGMSNFNGFQKGKPRFRHIKVHGQGSVLIKLPCGHQTMFNGLSYNQLKKLDLRIIALAKAYNHLEPLFNFHICKNTLEVTLEYRKGVSMYKLICDVLPRVTAEQYRRITKKFLSEHKDVLTNGRDQSLFAYWGIQNHYPLMVAGNYKELYERMVSTIANNYKKTYEIGRVVYERAELPFGWCIEDYEVSTLQPRFAKGNWHVPVKMVLVRAQERKEVTILCGADADIVFLLTKHLDFNLLLSDVLVSYEYGEGGLGLMSSPFKEFLYELT